MKQKLEFSVGPMFLLFLVFLVLKLTSVISWSWLWITAPLWGGLALFVSILILMGLAALIYNLFN